MECEINGRILILMELSDAEKLRDIIIAFPDIESKDCNSCAKNSCETRQKNGSCKVLIVGTTTGGISIRAPIPRMGELPLFLVPTASPGNNVVIFAETLKDLNVELEEPKVVMIKVHDKD